MKIYTMCLLLLCITLIANTGYTQNNTKKSPLQTQIEKAPILIKEHSKEITTRYEKLFLAMQYGAIPKIKEESASLRTYLMGIDDAESAQLFAPTILYLSKMEHAKSYKAMRELFPFMVAPLLYCMPQECFHTAKTPCTGECSINRRYYTTIYTSMPSLILPAKQYESVQNIMEAYHNLHLALYSANEKKILEATQKLYTAVTAFSFPPLNEYMIIIHATLQNLIKQKTLEEQVAVFHVLTKNMIDVINILKINGKKEHKGAMKKHG